MPLPARPRRAFLPLLCLLLAALALAGCARRSASDTISFSTFGGPEELAAYQSLIRAFQATNPGAQVELRHIPSQGDYRRQLAASFAAGSPADVMLLDYPRLAAFAATGGLEPLTAWVGRPDSPDEAEFYPIALAAYRYGGELWCLPQNVSSLVVYYNQALFQAAGLPQPDAGWTQEQFVAVARALTVDEDGDGAPEQYGVGMAVDLRRLAPFIWQAGGEVVDDPAKPTRLALETAPALAALEWFAALQVTEGVAPSRAAESAESSENRFLNGRLGMYVASRRAVPTLRTITAFAWDVAALPQGEQAASVLHSDGFCMAARAANKEAAWAFIAFASAAEGQRILAETGRTVPSRPDVAQSAAFLRPDVPPANSQLFLDVVPTLYMLPLHPNWPAIEEGTNAQIERVFYGEISPAEGAQSAVVESVPLFAAEEP